MSNATLSEPGAGIALKNVINGKLENNICTTNIRGIFLSSSSNNTIENNIICSNNYDDGIYLYSLNDNNIIRKNNCSENGRYGIYLYNSRINIILYNTLYRNTGYGVYIGSYSTRNTIHHNYFYQNNGASKGVVGNCQAFDDSGSNYWYDDNAMEGNYWSNWDGTGWGTPNAYPIDGGAGAYDMYPLGNPAVPELSHIPTTTIITIIAISIISLILTKHNHKPKSK